MKIITNNHKIVKSIFPQSVIASDNSNESRIPENAIATNLFQNQNLFQLVDSSINFWDKFYLTEHSQNSQFDILHKLINSNFSMPNKIACLALTGENFHGFRNRTWSTEKGNIHLSIYYKPKVTFENIHVGLLVLAAVSILETIDSIPDLNGLSKTKWVNDIVINNSKVAGIITQSFSQGNKVTGALIGIGLNVEKTPNIIRDNFTPEASCLTQYSNSEQCNFSNILNELLKKLSINIEILNNAEYLTILKKYKDRSAIIGNIVEIYTDPISGDSKLMDKGKVLDINEKLELILENEKKSINKGRLILKN